MAEMLPFDWLGLVLVIPLAFAPAGVWLWYFHSQDIEPEPWREVMKCFVAGILVSFPAAMMETQFWFIGPILVVILLVPVVEECLKFCACYLISYRRKDFNEPMDGVIYAVAVALGFATSENVLYLYRELSQGLQAMSTLMLARVFFTMPGHALFGIMWGYALGRAKFEDRYTGARLIVIGLGMAIAAHAIFNTMGLIDPVWALGMMVFVPVAWGIANRRIADAIQISPHGADSGFKSKIEAFKARLVKDTNSGRWFDNRFIVGILLFFVFFPAGFYALYRNTTFSMPEKVSYAALWLLILILFRP